MEAEAAQATAAAKAQVRAHHIEQGKREPDIATIYTTHDEQQA